MIPMIMMCVLAGAVGGVLCFLASGALLSWLARRTDSSVDVEQYYENMAALKHEVFGEQADEAAAAPLSLRMVLLRGVAPAVAIAAVIWMLSLRGFPMPGSAAIVALVWLAFACAPLMVIGLRRARKIAILEIASILELVARSETGQGDRWGIAARKNVAGGDLFGEDEEDRLELLIRRTDVAPIMLGLSGKVVVAEAGVGRTVTKSGLRELRLKGWFVNEISETEAEFRYDWSLSDASFADIANDVAETIERLGFSLRNVRLSRIAEQDGQAARESGPDERPLSLQADRR